MSILKPDIWEEMINRWPSPVVERSKVGEFSGGLVAPGTIANADSKGEGPAMRIKYGKKKVGYPVSDLIDWLKGRSTILTNNKIR